MTRISPDDYIPLQPNVLGVAQDGLYIERSTGQMMKAISGNIYPMYTQRMRIFEDFHGSLDLAASAGTPGVATGPWRVKDTSSAGAPLYRQLGDTHGGVVELLHDNTSEVQVVTLYWGDEQTIGYNKSPEMITRIRVPATPSAANFLVWGLASAQNDTEDSVAINAWMRLEAASLAVKLETDDGTTDSDDKTGWTMTANVWYETKVAISSAGIVTFFYRSSATASNPGPWIALAPQTFTIAAGTTNLQPYVQLRKSSGTTTDTVQLDWIELSFDR